MNTIENEIPPSTKINTKPRIDKEVVIFPRVNLTPRRQEVLELAALGLNVEDIAKTTNTQPTTVKIHRRTILNAFGVNSMLEAVIKGVKTRNINLYESTKDLEPKKIEELSKREREVLDTIIRNVGINTRYETIAEILEISKATVRVHIQNITSKLQLNMTRAALLYLRYKMENSQIQSSGVIFQGNPTNAVGE